MSLFRPPSKDPSACEAAAESADLDPSPRHTNPAPSRRMPREQGQPVAQAEGQSSQSLWHNGMGALPHLWESMGTPEGQRPSQSTPIHRQQLLQAGIIGVPNSGKSTLTNALVGSKVSCFSSAGVSGRSQTAALDMKHH